MTLFKNNINYHLERIDEVPSQPFYDRSQYDRNIIIPNSDSRRKSQLENYENNYNQNNNQEDFNTFQRQNQSNFGRNPQPDDFSKNHNFKGFCSDDKFNYSNNFNKINSSIIRGKIFYLNLDKKNLPSNSLLVAVLNRTIDDNELFSDFRKFGEIQKIFKDEINQYYKIIFKSGNSMRNALSEYEELFRRKSDMKYRVEIEDQLNNLNFNEIIFSADSDKKNIDAQNYKKIDHSFGCI